MGINDSEERSENPEEWLENSLKPLGSAAAALTETFGPYVKPKTYCRICRKRQKMRERHARHVALHRLMN